MAAGLAQISPMQIVPYNYYSFLMILFGGLSIVFNVPRLKGYQKETIIEQEVEKEVF